MSDVSPAAESKDELARLVRDAEAFKLALSLLSPEGPGRGLRLLQKAYQAIYDRAECAEREADWLRKELVHLKQAKGIAEAGE
jgi:hypothetical protein